MSHDRGCGCGRERYEYETCPHPECGKRDMFKEQLVMTCREEERLKGGAYPRSCPTCGLAKYCPRGLGEQAPAAPPIDPNAPGAQVGGSHYHSELQHWDLIELYGFGYLEGCATKYLVRWRTKNGVEDLKKARHYTQKLAELNKAGKRFAKGMVPDDVFSSFVRFNNIPAQEAIAIGVILSWIKHNHLDKAIEIIDKLIAEAEKPHIDNTGQANVRGYTGEGQ